MEMEPEPITERSGAEAIPTPPRPSVVRSGSSYGDEGSTETIGAVTTLPANAVPPADDPPPANIAFAVAPAKRRARSRKPIDPNVNTVQVRESHVEKRKRNQFLADRNQSTHNPVRESLLEVGSPVYAPFPGKNPSHEPYYWGTVTKKSWIREREYTYNIHFDDGDKLYNFSSHSLFRMEEILQEFIRGDLKVLLKPPKKYIPLWNSKRDGPVPIEYFQDDSHNRCTKCWQCMFLRQRCGSCALCQKSQERTSSSQRKKLACIQTVSVRVCSCFSFRARVDENGLLL